MNADSFFGFVATQTLVRVPGDSRQAWRENYLHRLMQQQSMQSHERGSWAPLCKEDEPYGRLYTTALAICTLEVYYRYLPIYSYDAVKPE